QPYPQLRTTLLVGSVTLAVGVACQLPEDLVTDARPEVGVGVAPRIEPDLDNPAAVGLLVARGQLGDLLAQQPHEVALARTPFSEKSDRQGQLRIPAGHGG